MKTEPAVLWAGAPSYAVRAREEKQGRPGSRLGRVGCGPVRQRGAAAEWAAPSKAGREGGGRRPGWFSSWASG